MKKVGLLSIFIGVMLIISIGVIAQEETPPNPVITVENIDQLEQIAMLGRGDIYALAYSPDGKILAVATSAGIWLHDTSNWGDEPHLWDGHSGGVTTLEYSPDGLFIASGSDDGTILLWDVQTGETIRVLGQIEDELTVNDLSFSPNGEHLVAGYSDEIVRVLDIITGEVQFLLEGHAGQIVDVAYSPDGRFIASASNNESVRLWDAKTGDVEDSYDGISIAFSPDGQSIAIGQQDGSIQIRNLETGDEKQNISGHRGAVYSLSYSATGEFIISSSRGSAIQLNDSQTGISKFDIDEPSNRNQAPSIISPDGQFIVVVSIFNDLWIGNSQSGEKNLSVDGYLLQARSVFYTPDSKFLILLSSTHIFVLDSLTYQIHFSLSNITDFSLSLVEDSIFILCRQEKNIMVYNLLTKELIFSLNDANDEITRMRLIDERFITLFNQNGGPQILDLITSQVILSFENLEIGIIRLDYSPDKQFIAFATADEPIIHIVNIQTGEEQQRLDGGAGNLLSVQYSDDGQSIVATSDDKNIYIWDIATGELRQTINSGFEINYLTLTTDNSNNGLIIAHLFEQTIIWNEQTGSIILDEKTSLVRLNSNATSVVYVVGNIINHMNIETGEIIFTITMEGITSMGFIVDDNLIIIGNANGSVSIINAQTGNIELTLDGHKNIISNFNISQRGDYIITASLDNTIRIWGIPVSPTP